jgi:hypothetical protein
MADSNMTIGAEDTEVTSGRKARLRKVTFTHTAAGTAAGNATTTFNITGKLLRYITTGGDAEWQFSLNDGTADIFSSGNLTATATSGALSMHATIPHDGIPLVEQTLKCTTANVSGTAPTITVIWEESETMR